MTKKVETTELTAEQKLAELQASYDSLVAENEALIKASEVAEDEYNKMNKTVARLQSSADNSDKYRDQLVALKGDFDSYKKRMRNDSEASVLLGKGQAVELMLPLLDTFGIAKAHLEGDNLVAFEMVEKQMLAVLTELGVTQIEAMGLEFDTDTMNALSSMDRGEENSGKVVEVYQQGYRLGAKILRYAQVIVGA